MLLALLLWTGVTALGSEQDMSAWMNESWRPSAEAASKPGANYVGIGGGAGVGMRLFGGHHSHDFLISIVDFGWIASPTLGEGRWWRGYFEIETELFLGTQWRPESAYLVGLAPLLKYQFAPDTSFAPFVEAGIGPAATNIGPPDLSSTFQFIDQAGAGVNWFWKGDAFVTLRYRILHVSNGGIQKPNSGVNSNLLLLNFNQVF